MTLAEGAEIVAMAILPAGVVPEVAPDEPEEEEEEEGAVATSSISLGEDEVEGEEDGSAGDVADIGPCLLLVSRQGLGKRTPIADFRLRAGRTGRGIKALKLNPGDRLAAVQVVGVAAGAKAAEGGAESGSEQEERGSRGGPADVLLSTQQGQLVRVPISRIRVYGRAARGRRVIKVRENDEVIAATVLSKQD